MSPLKRHLTYLTIFATRNRLPVADLEGGGETVLASSYFPLITGFRRAELGKMWSEAQQLLGRRMF